MPTTINNHSVIEDTEGQTTIYRCDDCGLIYQSEDTFEMFRCSPIGEKTHSSTTQNPPDTTEFED